MTLLPTDLSKATLNQLIHALNDVVYGRSDDSFTLHELVDELEDRALEHELMQVPKKVLTQ
jgi:hypothetical protein